MKKISFETLCQQLKKEDYHLICVCGKMAGGKNYISSRLENLGFKAIDADILAHKAIETEEAKRQIIKKFGAEAEKRGLAICKGDGSIDRRELGKILFEKPEYLKSQEEIVYPIITKMIYDFLKENPKTIINATVLFKTPELMKSCQAVVFVQSALIKRFFRAKKRDHLSTLQIFRRFYVQKDLLLQYKKNLTKTQTLFLVKN